VAATAISLSAAGRGRAGRYAVRAVYVRGGPLRANASRTAGP
jgi:hypothetical protein